MPDQLDLGLLRASGGLQEGEEELPQEEEAQPAPAAVVEPSPEIVSQLSAMGFSADACKKAAFHTRYDYLWSKPTVKWDGYIVSIISLFI